MKPSNGCCYFSASRKTKPNNRDASTVLLRAKWRSNVCFFFFQLCFLFFVSLVLFYQWVTNDGWGVILEFGSKCRDLGLRFEGQGLEQGSGFWVYGIWDSRDLGLELGLWFEDLGFGILGILGFWDQGLLGLCEVRVCKQREEDRQEKKQPVIFTTKSKPSILIPQKTLGSDTISFVWQTKEERVGGKF